MYAMSIFFLFVLIFIVNNVADISVGQSMVVLSYYCSVGHEDNFVEW